MRPALEYDDTGLNILTARSELNIIINDVSLRFTSNFALYFSLPFYLNAISYLLHRSNTYDCT